MTESSQRQKATFQGMLKVFRQLQPWERSLILQIIEGAHIPPIYRYLVKDEKGDYLDAQSAEAFISAAFGIVREAMIFGISIIGFPLNITFTQEHPLRFTPVDMVFYAAHKPRGLSAEMIKYYTNNIPDSYIGHMTETVIGWSESYLRIAQFESPDDWTQSSFSDFVEIQKPIPAPHVLRIELIRLLVGMRLYGVLGALEAMEQAGESLGQMDDVTLLSSLDASILAITEQYLLGVEQGTKSGVVIQKISKSRAASHRLMGQNLPSFEPPFTFARYMDFYLRHAHSHALEINSKMIPVAVRTICAYYGRYGAPLIE